MFVDDATVRLMELLFVPTESTPAYFAVTRAYIERHGKPMAFYSDRPRSSGSTDRRLPKAAAIRSSGAPCSS